MYIVAGGGIFGVVHTWLWYMCERCVRRGGGGGQSFCSVQTVRPRHPYPLLPSCMYGSDFHARKFLAAPSQVEWDRTRKRMLSLLRDSCLGYSPAAAALHAGDGEQQQQRHTGLLPSAAACPMQVQAPCHGAVMPHAGNRLPVMEP